MKAADIIIELYEEKTVKVVISFNFRIGHCGGQGEGTWNTVGSLMAVDFKLTSDSEDNTTIFSTFGVKMFSPFLFESGHASYSILGKGEIINPGCFYQENKNFCFYGVYSKR